MQIKVNNTYMATGARGTVWATITHVSRKRKRAYFKVGGKTYSRRLDKFFINPLFMRKC